MKNEMTAPSSDPNHSQPRHVLLVLDYFHPYVGGAETLFWQYAKGMVDDGDQVVVVTMKLPGTVQTEIVEGVEIIRIKTPFWRKRFLFTNCFHGKMGQAFQFPLGSVPLVSLRLASVCRLLCG